MPKLSKKLNYRVNFLLSLAALVSAGSVSAAVLAFGLAQEVQPAPEVSIPIVAQIVSEPPVVIETDESRIQEFGIVIEKVGIRAPVIPNVDGADKSIYKTALKRGTAHLKGTKEPGEGSNVFIYGHSSRVFGPGTYASVFSPLKDVYPRDKITVIRNGAMHEYEVFERIVVEPTDVSVVQPTPTEQLTLMTCWPIGSLKQRLIIKASPVVAEPTQI